MPAKSLNAGLSPELLKAILDAIPDIICSKNRDLQFTGCNAAFETFAGRSMADVLGQTCHAIFTDPWADRARAAELKVLENGIAMRGEDWVTYPDGRRVLVDMLFAPVRGLDNSVQGLVNIGRDITERRKLEDQLRQSQKLDAVGQLAGGVAHDFNNLLTVILSNLEMARERPTPDLLNAAETATRRAAELTGQLLGFARRQPLRSEPVNLNDRLRELTALIRRTIDPRIVFTLSLSREPAIILGDPGQIDQVLLNLSLNARDAMPAGGTLAFSTTTTGDEVILRIRDTGLGMSSEVQSHIFEPFYTTKNLGEGTGLGLAVVFGIVEAHGGRILCESIVGEGTTFVIHLPAHQAEIPAVAPAATTPRTTPLGARILLADDEPMIRELARLILEPQGYTVTLAADGLEAVKAFRAAPGQFDLVVLDLTMPNLAGRDALKEIRAIHPTVPVLLASGYSQDRGVISPTTNGFLAKPFTPADLIAAVQKALTQS